MDEVRAGTDVTKMIQHKAKSVICPDLRRRNNAKLSDVVDFLLPSILSRSSGEDLQNSNDAINEQSSNLETI